MTEKVTTLEELTAALKDIQRRRIEAFMAGCGKGLDTKELLALIPEATTPEDFGTLAEAIERLDEFGQIVASLVKDMWPEWGKYRCAVCGMTQKQAEAAGYDCAYEC